MLRYINFIFLMIALNITGAVSAVAQKTAGKPLTVQYDSVNLEKKTFNQPALQQYQEQADFKYDDTYQGTSLWERFWRWFWSFFNDKDASALSVVITYTLMALGVAALVFLIMKLAGVDPMWLIRGKSADASLPYNETIEN